MKAFIVFAILTSLSFAEIFYLPPQIEEPPPDPPLPDTLKLVFDAISYISGDHTINIRQSYTEATQAVYSAGEKIVTIQSVDSTRRKITNNIDGSTPLFSITGGGLTLTLQNIEIDSTGKPLMTFGGQLLKIESGTFTGTTETLITASAPVTIGTSGTPEFTAQKIVSVTGNNELKIIKGRFSGTSGTTSLITAAGPITIGDGGTPIFKNLGNLSISGVVLKIISGTFDREEGARSIQIVATNNATVTIGGTETSPQFTDLTSLIVNNGTLTIISGSFTNTGPIHKPQEGSLPPLPEPMISTTNTTVTIGSSTTTPQFIALENQVLSVSSGSLTITKGIFTGESTSLPQITTLRVQIVVGTNFNPTFNCPYALNVRTGSMTIRDEFFLGNQTTKIITNDTTVTIGAESGSQPSITNLKQLIIGRPGILNILGGSLTGESSSDPMILTNDTAVTIGSGTSTPSFSSQQALNVIAGSLTITKGIFIGTSNTLPQITTSGIQITYGANFNPTFNCPFALSVIGQSLTIGDEFFPGNQPTKIKTSGTTVTIGSTGDAVETPSITSLDQLEVDGGSLTINSGTFSKSADTPLINVIGSITSVKIGQSNSVPSFTCPQVIDIKFGSLEIDKGTFTGTTETLITASAPVTIGTSGTPEFSAQKIVSVTGNNELKIIKGTFTGTSGTTSLITAAGPITIGDGGTPIFKNLGSLSISGVVLKIISGTFTKDIGAEPIKIVAELLSEVTIGGTETSPQFTDLSQISIKTGSLSIISGSFTSDGSTTGTGEYEDPVLPIPMIVTTKAAVKIGEGNYNPTFTGINLLTVENEHEEEQPYLSVDIVSGTFKLPDNNLDSELPLITTTNAAINVGDGGTPSFDAADALSISGGSLNILSGGFTRSENLLTKIKVSNSVVIIGSADDAVETPSITSLDQLEVDGGSLTINSGTFSKSADTPLFKITGDETTVNIGQSNSVPQFTCPQVIDINLGSLDIQKGTFNGTSDIIPIITSSNSVINIGAGGSNPTFTGVQILTVVNDEQSPKQLHIESGTYTLPDESESTQFLITADYAAVSIGGYSSPPQFTSSLSPVLTTTGGSLIVNNAIFSGSSEESIITTTNTVVTVGNGGTPQFNCPFALSTQFGRLDILDQGLSGDQQTKIKTSETEVSIGTQESTQVQSPTISNLEQIEISGGIVNVYYGTFTKSTEDPLFKISNEAVINIGGADNASPSFSSPNVLDVNSSELNIIKGSFTGTDEEVTLITASDSKVTIGEGGIPEFTGVKLLEVANTDEEGIEDKTLNIISGTFQLPLESEQTSILITTSNIEITIGNENAPEFANNTNFRMNSGRISVIKAVSPQIVINGLFTHPNAVRLESDTLLIIESSTFTSKDISGVTKYPFISATKGTLRIVSSSFGSEETSTDIGTPAVSVKRGCNQFTISESNFTHLPSGAVELEVGQSSSALIDSSRFTNCGSESVAAGALHITGESGSNSGNVSITNNQIESCNGSQAGGILLGDNVIPIAVTNNTFANNTASASDAGSKDILFESKEMVDQAGGIAEVAKGNKAEDGSEIEVKIAGFDENFGSYLKCRDDGEDDCGDAPCGLKQEESAEYCLQQEEGKDKKKGLGVGAIVGIAVGAAVVVVAVVVIVVLVVYFKA